MNNKKGFLLAEETLKIILAVIVMGFLIYFLTALYFTKINDQKKVQAEQLLKTSGESIEMKINNLKKINPAERQLVNPKGWSLFGFVNNKKPNSCLGKNCLCICEGVIDDLVFVKDRQIKECDKDGTCLIVENLKEFNSIEINKQWISFEEKDNLIYIREK
ncbi:MAG: hypothetical protein KKF48_04040 [Nanoarchaeota archaeon]|nr:hypothetical protein [Nanoarchaeota archaeon]MBU1028189.1 hypothetical protein [Nanoarchaeota archaeon]